MDNHSRSASPRDMTAARPQHKPPSPPPVTPPAFENRAYTHDEDHNHNDSFTSQQQNGHTKDQPNGTQTKTPEAVNLELINLTPKNGSKKKDVEVDMNAANPYDEYFVPVNEHRKYMRGEKLYVTADKRSEKGGCKRPLCWTLLALVAAAVIALIVLAATGILFTNTPTTLDQFNSSSVSSARAFGGIGGDSHGDHDAHDHSNHDHSHDDHSEHDDEEDNQSALDQDHSDHDQNDHDREPSPVTEPTPEPTPEPSEMPKFQTVITLPESDESSDDSMYVPRTLEGELRIDNEVFSEELIDSESEKFKQFNENFGNALKRALFDRYTLENGNNEIHVEVINMRPGSLRVTYRIHWKPKTSTELPDELLTVNSLKMSLENYLDRNSRMINVYHIAGDDKISIKQVLDLCHLNKNDCEYGCAFDEKSLDFICTCPRGQIIDEANTKKCIAILDAQNNAAPKEANTAEDTKQKEFRLLEIGYEGTTTKQIPDEEKPKDNFDWKSSEEKPAETTTIAEAEYKYSHVFGNSKDEHIPTTSEPEPGVEPEPTAQPEPIAEHEPSAEPEPATEPKPTAEPEPPVEIESTIQSDMNTLSRHFANTNHELESETKPAPSTQSEPVPTSEPEPIAEPEPSAQPEPEPTGEPEPVVETELKPSNRSDLLSDPRTFILPDISAEVESTTETEKKAEPSTTSKLSEVELTSKLLPEPETVLEIRTTTESAEMSIMGHLLDETTTAEIKHAMLPFHERANKHNNLSSDNNEDGRKAITSTNNFDALNKNIKIDNEHFLSDKNRSVLTTTAPKENLTTSESIEENEDISFDHITKNNENSYVNPFTTAEAVEIEHTTSISSEPLLSIISNVPNTNSKILEENNFDANITKINNLDTMNVETNTTSDIKIQYPQMEVVFNKTLNAIMEPTTREISTTMASIHKEARVDLSGYNKSMTPENSTTTPDYYLSQGSETYQPNISIGILEFLENQTKTTPVTIKSKEKGTTETNDITFDTINTLLNRSSKAIADETISKNYTTEELTTESVITTTLSDWLVESVDEIEYKDMINSSKIYITTTDQSMTKIEEIINKAYIKNDFEPEYLNIDSTKEPDHEESLYGMVHNDYDTEDYRVKRVNSVKKSSIPKVKQNFKEKQEIITNKPAVEKDKISASNTTKIIESNINTNVELTNQTNKIPILMQNPQIISSKDEYIQSTYDEIESTTLSQYIYKLTDKIRDEPAPVWERVEEPVSTVQITPASDVINTETSAENDNKETTDSFTEKEIQNENSTQVKNLNVTIYEIPGKNHSTTASKLTVHSSEYVDHEIEMNPFLPEVENNKNLVKKLQEGHDIIDPVNLNETQSENPDEHSAHPLTLLPTNETLQTIEKGLDDISKRNENESTFNELNNENYSSPVDDPIIRKRKSKLEMVQEKSEPVNTFLQDTDDLEVKRLPVLDTTEMSVTVELQTASPFAVSKASDDSEYLSVVPITEERREEKEAIRKPYINGGIQKFNDISDSSKKSEKRTFDSSKVDSVINNEA